MRTMSKKDQRIRSDRPSNTKESPPSGEAASQVSHEGSAFVPPGTHKATSPDADALAGSLPETLTAESADFLHHIGDTFTSGAFFRLIFTPEGTRRFAFLSTGFETLFGIPAANVLVDSAVVYHLFFPEDLSEHLQREQQSISHDEPFASEVRMQSLISGTRWVQFRAQPGYDTKGNRCLDGLLIDVTLHKQVEDQLREMATTDSLTSLANRRHFMQMAEHELHRATRYKRPLCLLMIDADHFKRVNDTYGHDVGDEVLRTLAQALRRSARKQDIPARLGGEEFAMLLPETPLPQAEKAAERLREQIESLRTTAGDHTVQITVSIGISTFCGEADTISKLLKRADDALYEAKQNGRNCVCIMDVAAP